jgi:ribosomal protein L15E
MESIKKIRLWWNNVTGQYHWFQVRYSYWKNGRMVFEWYEQIGVMELKTILNTRRVKKIKEPLHKNPNTKRLLSNGKLDVIVISYIGKFSR